MNNYRNFALKYNRNVLERQIISKVSKVFPNIEQYISAHRFPTIPKIVVYSSSTNSESLLKNLFPFYNLITPSLTAETDEIITRRIAEQLTAIDQVQSGSTISAFGYLLRGFPFNTNQALLLDRYINGVNLAISLRNSSESADYLNSVQPLLNYYSQRGTLLEFTHSNEPTVQQLQNLNEEIRINIKRTL